MSINKEPAAIMALVGAVIALALGFGLPVTQAQAGLIMAVVSAVLGLIVRSQVTAQPQVDALIRTAVKQPEGTSVAVVKSIQAEKDAK